MTSDRILQLSAAVEAMPEGPSRQRFSALLAELSEAEGVPTPVSPAYGSEASGGSAGPDGSGGSGVSGESDSSDGEEWSPRPSQLESLLGGVTTLPAVEAPVEEPKKRRWRRSS